MYIGPWQEYELSRRGRDLLAQSSNVSHAGGLTELTSGDGLHGLSDVYSASNTLYTHVRADIEKALQRALDPLSAQLAVDALHPLLHPSHSSTSPPSSSTSRRRRLPAIGKHLPSESKISAIIQNGRMYDRRVRAPLDRATSKSEPVTLPALRTDRRHLLRRRETRTQGAPAADEDLSVTSGGYDSTALAGVLRLARTQRKQNALRPIPPVAPNKVQLMQVLRAMYQPRSAMTAMTDSDPHEAMHMGDYAEDGLSAVAKYFVSPTTDHVAPKTDFAAAIHKETVDDSVDEMDDDDTEAAEHLLLWSCSLDAADS